MFCEGCEMQTETARLRKLPDNTERVLCDRCYKKASPVSVPEESD